MLGRQLGEPPVNGVSDFLGQNLGYLVIGFLVLFVARESYLSDVGKRLARAGRCARCRAENASIPLPTSDGVLCAACGAAARRKDQIGLLLMRGFVGFFACALVFGVAQSVSRGEGIPWDFITAIVMGGIIVPLFLMHRLRMPQSRNE